MKIFILIIALGSANSNDVFTTIVREFSTLEKCESARHQIVTAFMPFAMSVVKSHGCYEK